jgi:hypothetical protein
MNVMVTHTLVNGTFGGKPSYVSKLGSIPAHGPSGFGDIPISGTAGPPKTVF